MARFFGGLLGQQNETIAQAGDMAAHYAGLGNPDGKDAVIAYTARKLAVADRVLPPTLKDVPPHRRA